MLWASYTLLRRPGQLCQELYTQVGPLGCSEAAQKGLGCKCILLVLCWNQQLRCERMATALLSPGPWHVHLITKVTGC